MSAATAVDVPLPLHLITDLKRTTSLSESHSAFSASSAKTLVASDSFASSAETKTKTSYELQTVKSTTKTETMLMTLRESTKGELMFKENTFNILVGECLLADRTYRKAEINLDEFIGNINGQLRRGKDYSKSSKDVKIVGTKLYANCLCEDEKTWTATEIELEGLVRTDNGCLIHVAFDEGLSKTLSEVPWMKFKVVAEPDFGVIATHPVIQTTLARIAQTTVEHVTRQFEIKMAEALALTIVAVTESAKKHIESSMEIMTKQLAAEAQYAHLYSTYTASGYLKSEVTQSTTATGKAGVICELPAAPLTKIPELTAKPLVAKA